ncbi:MAG: NAD-binding protein [bacterium]
MKTLAAELAYFFRGHAKRNLKVLLLYVAFLIVLVLAYAFLFRYLMWRLEGREYSLITGVYWTVTAMTTLGFGDITFYSESGHVFSMLVTLSGVLFLLIILPFGAISLFIAPWMEERLRYRPRLSLPDDARGHVIICGWDPVTRTVARNLRATGLSYVIVESDYEQVARLDEEGVQVVYGIATDAVVLERVKVAQARALVANLSDTDNANLVLTVRSLCETPVVAVVTEAERVDLMEAAGANQALALRDILGGYLAVRATTRGAMSHVVDSLGDLLFAEIPAHGTPFTGLTLAEASIREATGASVIGIWERGRFALPRPETRITAGMVLLLVGTRPSLETLERLAGETAGDDLVIVIGYGTVGRSAAGYLARNNVPHILVEKEFERIKPIDGCGLPDRSQEDLAGAGASLVRKVVEGDASRRATLEEARIQEAMGAIVTTNDDGTNVFLTLACRQLNPRIRIVARANREENVSEIYAAGADFVVSYSSVGASMLTNAIEGRKTVFLTEGVHIFWRAVPGSLNGLTLARSHIRALTGATVIAVQEGDAEPELAVGPETVLREGTTLLMVGSPSSETALSEHFRS